MNRFVLGIDQSTSGTKALLFDETGTIVRRADKPHRQILSPEGWISHNGTEIYQNVLAVVKEVIDRAGIEKRALAAVGISNQRETAMIWDRRSAQPVGDAVVWQCDRAKDLCAARRAAKKTVQQKTGLPLSPYFSAAKIAWLLEHEDIGGKELCAGTMDSWLLFRLTGGNAFKTDYSNASRTQLFDIHSLKWDPALCDLFGIDPAMLPAVCDSNAAFGDTDFDGYLSAPVPILAVLGDSHGALYGQGCIRPGMAKATYGTGASVMMNTGTAAIESRKGLASSIAWGIDGTVSYVLEGNINYAGAVTKWLVDEVGLLKSAKDAQELASAADPNDTTYLVPAFTGLGAPHWRADVRAMVCGMSRTTGRAELVRAAEECIAYQVADIVGTMEAASGQHIKELRVDGGATKDRFLMQFQSDIQDAQLSVPDIEELSAAGAVFLAGQKAGIYPPDITASLSRTAYTPTMSAAQREKKYAGWQNAIALLTHHQQD